MTKDKFYLAEKFLSDINSLKKFNKNFYGAVVKEQPISDGILREDLEEFIDKEIEKLEKEFEEL